MSLNIFNNLAGQPEIFQAVSEAHGSAYSLSSCDKKVIVLSFIEYHAGGSDTENWNWIQNLMNIYAAYGSGTQMLPPVFSLPGGTYATSQNVILSCSPAADMIIYTDDGTDPKTSGTAQLYSAPIAVSTGSPTIIRAYALKTGLTDSEVVHAAYKIGDTGTVVEIPQFSPAPGIKDQDTEVIISCVTGGATIYYTTNGSDPSYDGSGNPTGTTQIYTAPITVAGNGTSFLIKARATAAGMTDSAINGAFYKIDYPVEILAVVYEDGGEATSSNIESRLNAVGAPGYTTTWEHPTYTYVPFQILIDRHWDNVTPAPLNITKRYKTGLDQGTFTPPATYLLYQEGGVFRVVDKFHLDSSDNGNDDGTDPDLIHDLISFSGWPPPHTRANLEALIMKRIQDHLDDNPTITISPDTGAVSNGTSVVCTFSEKALDMGTAGHYAFIGGTGYFNTPAHTIMTAAQYLAGTADRVTLVLTGLAAAQEGDQTLEAKSTLLDTSGKAFVAASASLKVDVTNPAITSGSLVAGDNERIRVNFNEGVYGNDSGAEATIANFAFELNPDAASDTDYGIVSITSVTKTDDTALAGGETTIDVRLDISGQPSGNERILIKPSAIPFYDAAGRPADMVLPGTTAGTTGWIDLNDVKPPSITGGTVLTDNRIRLDFNEGIYGDTDGNPATASNFRLVSTSDPDDSAGAIEPASVSKTDETPLTGGETQVLLTLDITGEASGDETVDIGPHNTNPFYDINGNAASTDHTGDRSLYDATSTSEDRRLAAFVLDFSGTMRDNDETIDGITQNRVYFLKEAVKAIIDVWKAQSGTADISNDQVGIVIFQTDTQEFMVLTDVASIPTDSTLFSGTAPGGGTAMGSGLARAMVESFDYTQTTAYKRAIILITDGIQNLHPYVYYEPREQDVPGDLVNRNILIDNITQDLLPPGFDWYTYDAYRPPAAWPIVVHNNGDGSYATVNPIPVYSIGIGDIGAQERMLQKISGANYHRIEDIWGNLQADMSQIITDLFSGSSIQVHSTYGGSIAADQSSFTTPDFYINQSVKNITVYLSWLGDEKLTFKLMKGSTVIRRMDEDFDRLNYRVGVINFPYTLFQRQTIVSEAYPLGERFVAHSIPEEIRRQVRAIELDVSAVHKIERGGYFFGTQMEPEGSWKVVIEREDTSDPSGYRNVPYYCVVYVDDSVVGFSTHLPIDTYVSDEYLALDIRLTDAKIPIERFIKGEVEITKPQKDRGSIASEYCQKLKINEKKLLSDNLASFEQMMSLIRKNKQAAAALQARTTDIVSLKPAGKAGKNSTSLEAGRFRASYNGATVPGAYRVVFKVKARGEKAGTFQRTIVRTWVVRFKPEVGKTIVKGRYDDKRRKIIIDVTPADNFGNTAGPGYKRDFTLWANWKNKSHTVDHFGGSYGVEIDIQEKELFSDSIIDLRFRGHILYKDTLKNLLKSDKTFQSQLTTRAPKKEAKSRQKPTDRSDKAQKEK